VNAVHPLQEPTPAVPAPADSAWPVVAHLAGLAAWLPIFPVLGGVLGMKRSDPAVEPHARAALNFQITCSVAAAVATLLMLVLVGFVLLPLVALAQLILTVIGTVKASSGERFDYPFSLEWVTARRPDAAARQNSRIVYQA
jgi:uncharacterized protein